LHSHHLSLPCCLSIIYSPCSTLLYPAKEPSTSEIYTLSLHDALPISLQTIQVAFTSGSCEYLISLHASLKVRGILGGSLYIPKRDRKSTRLNSSHVKTSYAVFCSKKKITTT